MIAIEDDGFLDVSIGEATVRIDVYEVFNAAVDIRNKEDEDVGINARLVELFKSKGFPELSQRAAVQLTNSLFDYVDKLKKKDVSASELSTKPD